MMWLRRREFHARPLAHEANELLLLHSAVRLPGIAPRSRAWQARVLLLNHGRVDVVETDENRTRIFRVQTGRSPVELQPRRVATWSRSGYRESHPDLELGTLVSFYWTMAAERSPSPESNRIRPFTKRLLDRRAARAEGCGRDRRAHVPSSSGRIRTSIVPINSGTPYR